MKKTILALLFCLMSLDIHAQVINPEFFQNGAKAHFLVSAGIGTTCMIASKKFDLSENDCLKISIAAGVIEEVKDSLQPGNTFSKNDLFWDVLGSYTGVKFGGFVISPNRVLFVTKF